METVELVELCREATHQPSILQEAPQGRTLPQSKGLTSEHGLVHTREKRRVLHDPSDLHAVFTKSPCSHRRRKVFHTVEPIFAS